MQVCLERLLESGRLKNAKLIQGQRDTEEVKASHFDEKEERRKRFYKSFCQLVELADEYHASGFHEWIAQIDKRKERVISDESQTLAHLSG